MNEESRRAEARRLRVDPGMSRAQLMEYFEVGNATLSEWLKGLEAPGWTRRPNAKDHLREVAVEMRLAGGSVPTIAKELGVSKSTAYLWTKHLPLDRTPEEKEERKRRHMEHMQEARWAPYREARDADRAAVNERMSSWVGELSAREMVLLGSVAYWCEGAKQKPWHKSTVNMQFINSDPDLILLFVRYLETLGLHREDLTYRLSIHESADVDAASRWWSEIIEVPVGQFRRPTLKTHKPSTVRRNVGDSYRGCLIVLVPKSSRLYWEVEAVMHGIAGGVARRGAASM